MFQNEPPMFYRDDIFRDSDTKLLFDIWQNLSISTNFILQK